MMESYGKVLESPSEKTKIGRKLLAEDPNHPGSLGIVISEAIEDTFATEGSRYLLASAFNYTRSLTRLSSESAHGLAYATEEALRSKRKNDKKIIAFKNCGHGLLDLSAYDE